MEKINDSRESILDRLKKAKPQPRPLPRIPRFDIPGNELQNFVAHLKGFDGDYKLFASREDAVNWLNSHVVASDKGKNIYSSVAEVAGTMTDDDFATEADMNVVDVCIGESGLAIGETGSLLVETKAVSPAAALFSTDLYLLVDRNNLVEGLQDAYARVNLSDNRYTAFFSGPSATADIEAVHITGAQGEISLTAVMYNCRDEDFKAAEEIMCRLPEGTPLGQPDAKVLQLKRETDLAKGMDSV